MRTSMAATARAMENVNTAAASAVTAADAVAAGPAAPLPGRVELPELRSLDAILGELGAQVRFHPKFTTKTCASALNTSLNLSICPKYPPEPLNLPKGFH
jgi:hypothetical protein